MSMKANRIVDPIQTRLARGYKPTGYIGSFIFPIVRPEGKESGVIPLFGKEMFRQYKTERAPRGDRNEGGMSSPKTTPYTLREHEISFPYDRRETADAEFDLRGNARLLAQESVLLEHEVMCSTLASNVSNYSSGHTLTLSGTDIWSDPLSKPLDQVDAGKEVTRSSIGRRANAAWCGAVTYAILKRHPQLLKFYPTQVAGVLTYDQIKTALELDYLFVGESVSLGDSQDNFADTMADIWGDDFGLFYLPPNYNPSANPSYSELFPYFGYTIGKPGYPLVDEWPKPGNKVGMVGYTDLFDVKIVGADSAFLIKNTKA